MPPPSPLRRRPDPPARRRQQVLAEAPDQPGGKRIGERPVRRDREQRGSGAISHARSRLRSPESPRGRRYRTTTPDGRGRTRAPPRSRGPRTDWSKTDPRAPTPLGRPSVGEKGGQEVEN